ncbi:hypothetical protein C4D60_Mb01t26100 [Musa balbisiana]|uniref:Uncharacterized protein n=1 Tax=Musa balbisiana TaxID=52838 RepID=A0A4S8JQT7_MUSBA|nr:hypothetical protein C4D60_Mb01t26100 [Musa balbisiana]
MRWRQQQKESFHDQIPAIPEKQFASTTSLKASVIANKGEDSQAKPPAASKPTDGQTKQNGTQPPAAKNTSQRQESQHKQNGGLPQNHPSPGPVTDN